MTPQRLSVKFFVRPGAPVDLAPFTPLFHRWIQGHTVEGLLIDVADYKHVPDGPGVILIGHDVDYGLDLTGGKPGLLVRRKRYDVRGDLADVLRDTLRRALRAAKAIQDDGTAGVRFDFDTVEVTLIDRLLTPNTEAGLAQVKPQVQTVFDELYEGFDLRRGDADPRKNLSVIATAKTPAELGTLIDRLEARTVGA
jgi:hypothetical protein